MARKARSCFGMKSFFFFIIKLGIVLSAILSLCYIYLDLMIKQRVDGQVWELPAAIYGRMINLEPGMPYTQKELIVLLDAMQYRNVIVPRHAGEYSVQADTIELIRRSFDFPDKHEGEIHAKLVFNNDKLVRILNVTNKREFGFFRLDPKLITMLQSPNGEQRLFVGLNKFPRGLIKALLATEDRHFFQHDGINFFAIARAIIANLQAGQTVQGGSTLTQQLVKNLFLTNERSFTRKTIEAFMALVMEFHYSKERILELYLNEVYLGQNGKDGRGGEQIRGFPLASIHYFGRPVNELTLAQQTMLVGMLKGAALYNPWRNPELVMERRNLILRLLYEQHDISNEQYQLAINEPIGLRNTEAVIAPQPAFIQQVLKELHNVLGDQVKNLSNVKIFTTLDPVSQKAAENAVKTEIVTLRNRYKIPELEGSMVIVDRFSGEIRAMVGGSQPQFAGFNRVLYGRRPIGSLAKPPIYLTALSKPEKYQLNTWLVDEPLTIILSDKTNWQPRNYNRKFRGRVMLVDALTLSLNIPTVNLGLEIGLDSIKTTMIRLGVDGQYIKKVPAMLLGSTSLTPLELAQVYQTIASGGHRASLSSLRSVIAEDGRVLYESFPKSQLVVSPQASYQVLYAMQQVVAHGTAQSLHNRFGQYMLAAKTGTTNDLRDSWFVGIDGKEVSIAWTGRDDNGPTSLTGAQGALQLFRHYIENQSILPLKLTPPEGINMMAIDSEGHFFCGKAKRYLPAMISDPETFCAMQGDHTESTSENRPADVPEWVIEMFGNG